MTQKIETAIEIMKAFNLDFDNQRFKKTVYEAIMRQTIDNFKSLLTVKQMSFILDNSHLCNEGFICIKYGNKNIIIDSQAELNAFIVEHVINELR